jgi:hypothetical protein
VARDFRNELAGTRCWDRHTQAVYEARGEALDDCALQNREELLALCAFIEAHDVRSYLEIGVWTGRLLSALQALFRFDLVAACDHGWAEQNGLTIRLPPETRFHRGDSDSEGYERFRTGLGALDLVFVDANHAYRAVRRDFAVNRAYPHRFLAFHDILGATRDTVGVRRFWRALDFGFKLEIVRPHLELGLTHSTMGIGIWSEKPFPGASLA